MALGDAVIRVGIVGSNFGRTVLLPAFRADPRCEVVALAGRDAKKSADAAREAGIARAFKTWTGSAPGSYRARDLREEARSSARAKGAT